MAADWTLPEYQEAHNLICDEGKEDINLQQCEETQFISSLITL